MHVCPSLSLPFHPPPVPRGFLFRLPPLTSGSLGSVAYPLCSGGDISRLSFLEKDSSLLVLFFIGVLGWHRFLMRLRSLRGLECVTQPGQLTETL